jgi:hypothetical protein
MILTIIPIILGKGIPLFGQQAIWYQNISNCLCTNQVYEIIHDYLIIYFRKTNFMSTIECLEKDNIYTIFYISIS